MQKLDDRPPRFPLYESLASLANVFQKLTLASKHDCRESIYLNRLTVRCGGCPGETHVYITETALEWLYRLGLGISFFCAACLIGIRVSASVFRDWGLGIRV